MLHNFGSNYLSLLSQFFKKSKQDNIFYSVNAISDSLQNIIQCEQFNLTIIHMKLLKKLKLQQKQQQSRKQALQGVKALFKNSLQNKFLLFFEDIIHPKTALQKSEQQIALNLEKINKIIDQIHDHITARLQSHERQVFEIVQQQILQMNDQVRVLVNKLNQKITSKDQQQEVWVLNNQLDYFKAQALKLFSVNKQLRIQVKLLKNTLRNYQLELQNRNQLVKKIKKKCMKQSIKFKNKQHLYKLQSMRQQQIQKQQTSKIKIKDKVQNKQRVYTDISSLMRTEIQRSNPLFDQQSRVNIRISNKSIPKNNRIMRTISDDYNQIPNIHIPNFSGQSHQFNSKDMQIKEQNSFRQCIDRQTQTNQIENIGHKRQKVLSEDDVNEPKTNYIDLFKSGFKLNSTFRKTKQIAVPLRNSLDYQKKGINYMRSMNSSLLKNRIEDNNFMIKTKKQSNIFKKDQIYQVK